MKVLQLLLVTFISSPPFYLEITAWSKKKKKKKKKKKEKPVLADSFSSGISQTGYPCARQIYRGILQP
jgi:hypothetical protein